MSKVIGQEHINIFNVFRPLQRYTTNIENYMAEKYLDSMYKDKAFFKYIKNHPGVNSPNYEGQKKILALCKSGYEKLAYKQVKNRS